MAGDERLHHDSIYSREVRNGILKRIQRSFDPVLKDFEDDIHGIINDLNADIQSPSSSEQMDQHPHISRLLIRSSLLFRKLYSEYKMLYQSMTDMLSDDLVGPYAIPNPEPLPGTSEAHQLSSDIENLSFLTRQIEALNNQKQDLEREYSDLSRNFFNLQEQYDLLLLEKEESLDESVHSIGTRVPVDDTRFFPERSRSRQTPTPPALRDLSLHGWWGGTYYP